MALFDRSGDSDYKGIRSAHTAVDHFAFAIDLPDYEPEKFRLEGLGLKVKTAEHSWVHWRSLYIDDPEGNMVEWVCCDEGVGEGLSWNFGWVVPPA